MIGENQIPSTLRRESHEILYFEPKSSRTRYRLLMTIKFTRHRLVNLFSNSYQIVIKGCQKFYPSPTSSQSSSATSPTRGEVINTSVHLTSPLVGEVDTSEASWRVGGVFMAPFDRKLLSPYQGPKP